MKQLIYVCILILSLVWITSCTDMNDLHKKYLDEGEIVYAAMVDSVATITGKNKIYFEIFINSQRVDHLDIVGANGKSYKTVNIGGKTGAFDAVVDNLQEQQYLFRVISYDKYNNKSLPVEVSGTSLGENYEKTLLTRKITEKTLVNDTCIIVMSNSLPNMSNTLFTYTNRKGENVVVTVPANKNTARLPDFVQGREFSYVTQYSFSEKYPDFFSGQSSKGTFLVFSGAYHSTGYFTHPSSPRALDLDKDLVYEDDRTYSTTLADLGSSGYTIKLTINADNSVNVVQYSNGNILADSQPVPGAENSYNPVTKTFTLNYQYNAGTRRITETIVLK